MRCEELPGDDVISAVGGVALVNSEDMGALSLTKPLLITGIKGEPGIKLGLLGELIGAVFEPLLMVEPAAPELIEWVDDLRKKGMDEGVNLLVVEGRLLGLSVTLDSFVTVVCTLVVFV